MTAMEIITTTSFPSHSPPSQPCPSFLFSARRQGLLRLDCGMRTMFCAWRRGGCCSESRSARRGRGRRWSGRPPTCWSRPPRFDRGLFAACYCCCCCCSRKLVRETYFLDESRKRDRKGRARRYSYLALKGVLQERGWRHSLATALSSSSLPWCVSNHCVTARRSTGLC